MHINININISKTRQTGCSGTDGGLGRPQAILLARVKRHVALSAIFLSYYYLIEFNFY